MEKQLNLKTASKEELNEAYVVITEEQKRLSNIVRQNEFALQEIVARLAAIKEESESAKKKELVASEKEKEQ